MEKEIKQLKRYLLHSKVAVFAIVGFLVLLTYLLIFVSKQISSPDITYIYRPKAQTTTPKTSKPLDIIMPGYGTPGTPLTCKDYELLIINMHAELENLQDDCPKCPRPTGSTRPGFSAPGDGQMQPDTIENPTDPCSRYTYLHTYLNGLQELIATLCQRCPDPTVTYIPGATWKPEITAFPITGAPIITGEISVTKFIIGPTGSKPITYPLPTR